MTSGDIDAGTVLDMVAARHGPLGHVYISTWSMARGQINMIGDHADSGAIGNLTVLTGDYFAQRSPGNYTLVVQLCDRIGGRIFRLNNHSKVMAFRNPESGFCAVVEGSANFTCNPRVENFCLTTDAELYAHVVSWFEEIISGRQQHRIR